MNPIFRGNEQPHGAAQVRQAHEKLLRIAAALSQVLQGAQAAVVIDRSAFEESSLNDFLVFALQRRSQQQIQQPEKNRRVDGKQRRIAHAQAKRETSRQPFNRV